MAAAIHGQIGPIVRLKIQATIQSRNLLQHHVVINKESNQGPLPLHHVKYEVEDAANNKQLPSKAHLSNGV